MKLAEIRKALAALGAGVAVMVTAGLISGDLAVWLTTGIAAVTTALGVYIAPANKPTGTGSTP